jgi:transcriptional regulator with XRE-family HTH domain
MTLHFLDDIFGYNLALETTKGIFHRFALLQSNFCQAHHLPNQQYFGNFRATPFLRSLLMTTPLPDLRGGDGSCVPRGGTARLYGHPLACDNVHCMKVLKHLPKTGRRLRTRRLSLGLTLRDVYVASLSLARELRNPAFVLPLSRLHEIETKKITPSVYRLYTLSRVYRCRLNELLSWYGIPTARSARISNTQTRA